MFGTTIISSSDVGRGIGKSYWPNDRRARWPTIDPAVIATIVGCMACSIGPTMAASWSSGSMPASARASEGSSGGSVPSGGALNDLASRSSSGLNASSDLEAHSARFTGMIVSPRPPAVDSPVTLTTWSSATRASCSSFIRSIGSTLGSLWPSVATARARLRAASHGMPPP